MSLTRQSIVLRRPSRLAALHELFERNYRLVEQLVPELDLPYLQATSRSATDPDLQLIVLERGPYTSAFRLTYEIEGRCEPDMWVRVYRDARVAESLHCAERPRWLALEEGDPEVTRYLSAQWQRNLMLHKWLQHLLEAGHGFGVAHRPRLARGGKK